MEIIRGKMSHTLDLNGLLDRLTNYNRILLDLGTGDGRYVRFLAERNPGAFIIGVDACRENLYVSSRTRLPNVLFVIASAQNLPHELCGLASHITINFPWGSLLEGLLAGDAELMNGLRFLSKPGSQMDIHLNGGALAEAGTSLDAGTQRIYDNIHQQGWTLKTPGRMDARALKNFPTTWAKRLAYGRDPRATALRGSRIK